MARTTEQSAHESPPLSTTNASNELILLVSLWVDETNIERFEAFERQAVQRMAKYGGRVERAIRFDDRTTPACAFEVHVVSFPNAAAFHAYQEDPETQSAAALRNQIVTRSHVRIGRDVTTYGSVPQQSGNFSPPSDPPAPSRP